MGCKSSKSKAHDETPVEAPEQEAALPARRESIAKDTKPEVQLTEEEEAQVRCLSEQRRFPASLLPHSRPLEC
jgi:hypothetical protein